MSETAARPSIEVNGWRHIDKGPVVGSIETISLPSGLILHGCLVMTGERGPWVALPSKPRIGRDGTQMTTEGGKRVYDPCVSFADRDRRERFSAQVIDALRLAYPNALA